MDKERKNLEINEFINMANRKDIVKHSPNIIDLIEVGDIVNGYEVVRVAKDRFIEGQTNVWLDNYIIDKYGDIEVVKITRNEEIKKIITKELLKSVEYVIE